MKCLILYSSMTGNTKKLAETVHRQLDGLVPMQTVKEPVDFSKYDTLCLGYWIKKGGCDKVTKKVWENIHGKRIVLFGTMAADVNSELGKSQMERIEKALPADNNIVAHFACQGAMSAEALEQYRDKVEQEPFNDLAQAILDNAMNCSGHPDKMDELNLMRDVQYAIGR